MKIKRVLLISFFVAILVISSFTSQAEATFIGAANDQKITAYIATPGALTYYE